MVVGLLMSIAGYLLVSDWQTMTYDQCTEYSPFHHPELIRNGSIYAHSNRTRLSLPKEKNSSLFISFILYSEIDLHFDDGKTISTKSSSRLSLICQQNTSCPLCDEKRLSIGITSDDPPCLTLTAADNLLPKAGTIEKPLTLFCTLQQQVLCVNIHNSNQYDSTTVSAHMSEVAIQSLPLLSDDVYDVASNSCMNALDGQCHWIPFSTITHKKCVDCPPICRGKHRTLLLPPFIIGIAILLLCTPFTWVPTIALANNQTPKSIQVSLQFNERVTCYHHFTHLIIILYDRYCALKLPMAGNCYWQYQLCERSWTEFWTNFK